MTAAKEKGAAKGARARKSRAVEPFVVEMRAIETVKPYPDNARKRSRKAVDKIAASITRFGWQQPIVVDRKGVIIVGHGRLEGAKRLGMTVVPVKVSTMSEDDARAYRIADNRIAEDAAWTDDTLLDEIRKLDAKGIDATITGFDRGEIDRMLLAEREGETRETVLEQAVQLRPQREYVVVMCADDGGKEFERLRKALRLPIVRKGGYKKWSAFDAASVQRVIPAADLLAMVEGGDGT